MSPDGLILIGPLGLAHIREHWTADSIGGLTLGADPIAYAISYTSAMTNAPLRAFTIRKEAKVYGAGKLIEGPFNPGDHTVIIEDVITTGNSALKAVSAIEGAGGLVVGVLALVDRQEGGRETIEAAGIPVVSIVTAGDLLPLITVEQ